MTNHDAATWTNSAGLRAWVDRLIGLLAWIAKPLALVVIAVYVGLIPAGRWQADEYQLIALYREEGAAVFWDRVTHWSPRPVSELLLYLYVRAVAALDRPLIGGALLVLWAILIVAFVAGCLGPGPMRPRRGLLAGSVLALFLLGNPIGEMFYWPQGAVAYLVAMAGIVLASLQIIQGLDAAPGRRWILLFGLLLAAGSAEAGAMAALWIAGLLGLVELSRWRCDGATLRLLGLTVPLAASLAVFVTFMTNRAAGGPEVSVGGPYNALFPSLLATLQHLQSVVSLPRRSEFTGILMLVFAWAGFACCLREAGPNTMRHNQLLALAMGLLGAAFVILAGAYFQFGIQCCQRLDTFRWCLAVLIILALGSVAALAAGEAALWVWRHVPAQAGPAMLSIALLTGLAARVPALIAEYRQMPATIRVQDENWASGRLPGAAMVFRAAPPARVVNSDDFGVRDHFVLADNNPWFIRGVLRFFGKAEVDVRGP